jgi:hypothetical protein
MSLKGIAEETLALVDLDPQMETLMAFSEVLCITPAT